MDGSFFESGTEACITVVLFVLFLVGVAGGIIYGAWLLFKWLVAMAV